MPSTWIGQMITFHTVKDPDEKYSAYVWIHVTKAARTIRAIAANHGDVRRAHEIARLNGIHSTKQQLRVGRRIRLPGNMEGKTTASFYAQDAKRPVLKDGFAMFDVTDRYGEKGITHFKGYNPYALDVPIAFEGYMDDLGASIEQEIHDLERMAGRGNTFKGAASGPPATIRVSVTTGGRTLALIPSNLQWTHFGSAHTPLWHIGGIDWDDGVLSDDAGNRVRGTGTVHLFEHTPVTLLPTAATRSQGRGNSNGNGNK